MKTSILSLFALAGSLVGVLAAPAAAPAAELEVRKNKDVAQAQAIVNDLSTTLQPMLAAINTTSATISPTSSTADKAVAQQAIVGQVNQMVTAIVASTKQVMALDKKKSPKLATRQTATTLAQTIVNLLVNISNVLNVVVANLGLTAALAFLNPLVLALSNLLLALRVVVDDLLIIVRQLVDALLVGLSAALAGLIL